MANNVEKCIHILQSAKSDNEQFAGLLLVAKVIKAEECDEVTLQRLFDAIGFPFLTRLLRSSHVPEGCSPNVYRNLAVTVLSCFFQHPQLVMHPNVASCMPYFNDIITEKDSKSGDNGEESDQLVSDCYDCLSCIAAQPGGRAMLIKEQCVSALSVTVHKQSPGWERAEAVLLHLVAESGTKTWQGNEHGLHVLLFSLTQRFQKDQGAKKFELCKTLGRVLVSMEKEQLKGEVSAWTSGLYKGLTDIFKSKLGRDQRNPALMLASAAVDLLGVPWTMSVDGRMSAEGQNSQFLLLLVHLTCIEVRMTLEDRDLPQASEIGDLLVACYRLLENIISYLATGPTLALDGRKVGQLHAAMVGAFNAVLFFLTRVSEQHQDKSQSPLVLASLRVLGSWIAEETTALQKEVRDLLPFIFSVCSKNLQQRRQVLTPDDSGEKLPEKMDVGDAGDIPLPPGPPEGFAVPEVVRFLLPGLCHLSADDEARKVLLACGGPELLVSYFDYQWTFFASPGNTEDCKMALTTLCGVMLNLVVLEGAVLAAGDAGRALLRCATNGLPVVEYRENDLVLALNLAVLGLMMMRHFTDEDQAKCEPFCKSAIHLLSRAHCRKRTGPAGWSVHVSDTFTPHWADCVDLWHLGMQALAADLSVYPWLPRVVLGSGFVPIILRLLKDVKGDVEKDALLAYQGVLVAMAKNDKTAKQLLREQQAQQLARTHRMDELGRALAR